MLFNSTIFVLPHHERSNVKTTKIFYLDFFFFFFFCDGFKEQIIQKRPKNIAFKTVTRWSRRNDKNHSGHGVHSTGKEIFTSAPCEPLRMNITIPTVMRVR